MKRLLNMIVSCVISVFVVLAGMIPNTSIVHAEDTTGLQFNKLIIKDSTTGAQIADLLNGDVPNLHANVDYSLNVEYSVPSSLQFSNTYFHMTLGNGAHFTTLPGSTFTQGPITSTGFSNLIKTPEITSSVYNYITPGSPESKGGELIYQSKSSLLNVASNNEISFVLTEEYVNQDPNQILSNLFQFHLSTDATPSVDAKSYNAKAVDELRYNFWLNQATEIVSKGGTTATLSAAVTGNKSLSEAGSKTSVEVVYPSDVELVSLEETNLYHANGTVVSSSTSGGMTTAVVEWNEPGSYSGGVTFMPHFKVPTTSARANGSTFNITLQNFKKTILDDNPNVDRTSSNVATFTVQIIDGLDPEIMTLHGLVDTSSNWALKKYDTYNVRLGSLLIKNELVIPTKPKTLEMTIDENNTAIIRGVTIPYTPSMTYGNIEWTAASGASGSAPASIIQTSSKVSALITNTALGLDINDSIKSIKVDLGPIPASYDGIRPHQDLLDTWNPANKHIDDGEFYGWSYISNGVFGSWKQGSDGDVVSTVKLYTTGQTPTDSETYQLIGKSKVPEVKNGVGTINKTQIVGGDTFSVQGRINDANWDWNPLQEPVLYMMMPEGFSYSNLTLTNGNLGTPEYVGEFDNNGELVQVWKYTVDVGNETRGQYQPDFTSKSMNINFDVQTNETAKVGTYHISDFFGFTTKDFVDIKAVIKSEHWDHSNWNTSKYTAAFGNAVNGGNTMVSLSEGPGIKINQAPTVSADDHLIDNKTANHYVYDNTSSTTKVDSTVVLTNNETATMHIRVRNNEPNPIDHTTLFVPLLKEGSNFGTGFMPEGENKLPLALDGVSATSNFTVKYIKVRDGKTYAVNHVPQVGDYDEVTDPNDANMLMITATTSLGNGDGGRIDITYKASNDLTMAYNNKVDVITPALDYDLNGNKSTLSLRPVALSFITHSVTVTKEWKDMDGTAYTAPVHQVGVELYRDGTLLDVKNVVDTDNWTVTFTNIEQVNPATGVNYIYTVKEAGADVDGNVQYAGLWFKADVTGSADSGFTITNTYTPLPADVNLPVKKKISGTPSTSSNFNFELIADVAGQPMPMGSMAGRKLVTISGSGQTVFGNITFTQPGTYQYKVVEINDGIANYTYDSTIYSLTYTVLDVSGQLVATTDIQKQDGTVVNDVVFTNIYDEPTHPTVTPRPSTPATADQHNIAIFGLMFGVATMAFIAINRLKKRLS